MIPHNDGKEEREFQVSDRKNVRAIDTHIFYPNTFLAASTA